MLSVELTEVIFDTSVILAATTIVIGVFLTIYDMRNEQKRIKRDIYGADDDLTRPGILKHQQTSSEDLEDRIDELEECMESKFQRLERSMVHRHQEMSIALRKMTDRMDEPPDDVDIRRTYDDKDEFNR